MLAHPTSSVKWAWNFFSMKALHIEQNVHFFTKQYPKIILLAQWVLHIYHPGIIFIQKVSPSTFKMLPCHRHFQ